MKLHGNSLGYRASLKFINSLGPFFAAIYDPPNRAQIGFVGWGSDYPAASQFLSMFRCQDAASANVSASQLGNHALDRAISNALDAQSTDSPSTSASWAEIDRRVMELAPWVPLVNPRAVVVVSRRVGNVQVQPGMGNPHRPALGQVAIWRSPVRASSAAWMPALRQQ